ncbi:helix-turn-helix domain-containing protein [Burkholderiaceae bacterium FT117]|uniref:XRE family transcriptional regulator n=1 Tax=Zeimonas sediminis TaxID=2944268 RepID=UPI002342FF37|nr:XRE family transcriptional regulator [Zeimonas sediminis]MCM5569924.1 helix-turn-helix domain-containing protein [Zeimonas sediminis]
MPEKLKDVMARLAPERRAKVAARARELADEMIAHADGLAAARRAHKKTQEEIANTLHIRQNAVAQLEKRSDLLISTLRKYVGAMGGELELVIRMANGSSMVLENIGELSRPEPLLPGASMARKAGRATGGAASDALRAKPAGGRPKKKRGVRETRPS